MDLGLRDKTVIVTGGASGIGRKTAETLAAEGANLVVADFNEKTLEEAASALAQAGAAVEAFHLDVREVEQCRSLAAHTVDRFGRIDGLVNSAGIGGRPVFFAETGPEDWRDLVDINLMGVIHCSHAVAERMIDQGYGKIVSLASEAGKLNEKRMVVYGATKGGVIAFTKGLAIELGRFGVNVNCVCPGITHSPMTAYIDEDFEKAASKYYPLGRLGRTDDIAPMITFLLSDKTSWVTGQAISVSGGFGRS